MRNRHEIWRYFLDINDIVPKPINEEARNEILRAVEKYEINIKQSYIEAKKYNKFKWYAIVSLFFVVQAILLGRESDMAYVFNLQFGIGAGFILFIYSIYQWHSLWRKSKYNHNLASDLREHTENKHAITILTEDCISVRDETYTYFISIPDFTVKYRRDRHSQLSIP